MVLPDAVLDLGAGDGALARPLAERVGRVDAVEISAAMVDAGRRRPGGDRPNLTWRVEPVESMSPTGPYGLVTAGASLHWMDWPVALDRIGRVLAPGAVLAIVDQSYHELRWRSVLTDVIRPYSRSPGYDPHFSVPDELEERGLFVIEGRRRTAPTPMPMSSRAYVEQFHSTASLARELMSPSEADRFDDEVAAVVRPYEEPDGTLVLDTVASVVWGVPYPS